MTPARVQINLTGFLERNAGAFSKSPAVSPLPSVVSAPARVGCGPSHSGVRN